MAVWSDGRLRQRLAVLGAGLLVCAHAAAAGQSRPAFQGRALADALRILQQGGLHIVFSSEIVTPEMRVAAEPRARAPLAQLDELVEPHGLKAERGPRSIIQIVRRRPADVTPGRDAPRASASAETEARTADRFVEAVIVRATARDRDAAPSRATLDAEGLQAARSLLHDDPLQTVQTLPGVAAADDFRSEFSVRGSPYRHLGVVIDGVSAPWLKHSVYGRTDAGSLSMFGNDVVDEATLQAGAYSRRHDDKLGAQLELTLRQGSRESTRVHASAGGTTAGIVADGPLGRQKRGSWMVGARNSYLTWPVQRHTDEGVAFAFSDAVAKVVYDATPTQQVTLVGIGGRSAVDWKDEPVNAAAIADGINGAALASVGWRIIAGDRTIIRQQASIAGRTFLNRMLTGREAARGSDRALSYQAAIHHAVLGGTLEAGTELRQLQGSRRFSPEAATLRELDAAWWTQSAYTEFARNFGRLSLANGVRLSHSTLVHARTLSPWMLGGWSFSPAWRVTASGGVSHQFPELEEISGPLRAANLAPERATSADIGVQHRFAGPFRWQATVFNRVEQDVLRTRDTTLPLRDLDGVHPAVFPGYENALSGTARGIDLLVARERAGRVSGWLSYTYATMRQSDRIRRETFWGDFDRRHTFNAAVVYRASAYSSVGLVLRGGTNLPVPGYFDTRNGALFIGEGRNDVRLPFYTRLDARAQRSFVFLRGRITANAEMLNVLNRANSGPADGFIQPATGEAVGFTRSLVGRRASAGIAVDFRTPSTRR
jgi:hypothetical protein